MKVLIITYYWPPSGGSGVQRWLKFVKYLPQFGYEPIVFTPENPAFPLKDESLLNDVPLEAEVMHFPIWEPYGAVGKLTTLFGASAKSKTTHVVTSAKSSILQRVATWVRGNFFIPDPRVFWVRPAAKFLEDFIRDNRIKTIITTGPPHSVHLIGYRLKKNIPTVRWIADFRDPWSAWGLLDSLKVSGLARSRHRALEKKVLTTADKVTTITPFYVKHFEQLSDRKVVLLTNGYDADDFKQLTLHRAPKFIIRHVGIVNEKCNPRPFLLTVQKLTESNSAFAQLVQVDFVGEVHPAVKAFVAESPSISAFTSFTPTVPHSELISLYETSAVLLLILTGYKDAEGYMPGKLFEYLAAGLPILGTGPEQGDAATLLTETGAGKLVLAEKQDEIIQLLIMHFEAWLNKDYNANRVKPGEQYTRKEITRALTEIL